MRFTDRRVAITGLGLVCPLGNTVGEAVANAFAGMSGIRRCDRYLWGEYGQKIAARVAGTVEGLDVARFVPAKYAKNYDRSVCYALAAAQEALTDSGIDFTEELRDRAGVMIGASNGGNEMYHRALHIAFAEGKAETLPGHMALQFGVSASSALVALTHKLRGPNFGVSNACATGGVTLSLAADCIRMGRADVVVAGATEAPIGLTLASLVNAGAMNPTDDPRRASRPFSADRAGLVIGEGSGILILEDMDHALHRSAKIYGEMLGEALTNDAYHLLGPEPSGRSLARVMGLAMQDAGIAPEDVDVISAYATSTPKGDLCETKAIKLAFGERAGAIPVSATKSLHGHAIGAAGAIETVLALKAMCQGRLLPTMNLDVPDPECDLDYVANAGRCAETDILLKSSFGMGGTNAALVIRRLLREA